MASLVLLLVCLALGLRVARFARPVTGGRSVFAATCDCARIAARLSPLALFSVGLQQRLRLPRRLLPAIGCGVLWKLLLAPAICLLVGRGSGVTGLVLVVSVPFINTLL
jgi:hypothetical protein